MVDSNGTTEYFVTSTWGAPTEGTCNNLVGWWPLNSDDKDYSGSANTTTVDSATQSSGYSSFASGSGISISPASAVAALPGANGMTYSIWVNYNAAGSYTWPALFVSGSTHVDFGIMSAGYGQQPYVEYGYSPYDGSAWGGSPGNFAITPGTWYLLSTTYDGSKVIFYVNGNQYWAGSIVINPLTGAQPINIGSAFNGSMKDARIYSSPLTPIEVSALYHAGAQ